MDNISSNYIEQLSGAERVEEHFDEIVGKHQQLLYRYATSKLNIQDYQLVQDLVQDTFYKLYEKRDWYSHRWPAALRWWLQTVLRNKYINHIRKSNNRPTDQINNFQNVVTGTIENGWYQQQLVDTLGQSIYQLPSSLRQALNLRIQWYKYNEIAEQLDLPLGTIKSRIFLARRKLAIILQEQYEFTPAEIAQLLWE